MLRTWRRAWLITKNKEKVRKNVKTKKNVWKAEGKQSPSVESDQKSVDMWKMMYKTVHFEALKL